MILHSILRQVTHSDDFFCKKIKIYLSLRSQLRMVGQLSWIEQQPSKLWVKGSSPFLITYKNANDLKVRLLAFFIYKFAQHLHNSIKKALQKSLFLKCFTKLKQYLSALISVQKYSLFSIMQNGYHFPDIRNKITVEAFQHYLEQFLHLTTFPITVLPSIIIIPFLWRAAGYMLGFFK